MLSHIWKVRGFVVLYNVMDIKSIDLDVGGKIWKESQNWDIYDGIYIWAFLLLFLELINLS
jgi:hypothetical protein